MSTDLTMHYPVIIVGAGVVGLSCALALAKAGIASAVIEARKPPEENVASESAGRARVSALNLASLSFLKELSVWPHIANHYFTELRELKVWQQPGCGHLHFTSPEIGLTAIGVIVENLALVRTLYQCAVDHPLIHFYFQTQLQRFDKTPDGVRIYADTTDSIATNLLVGADGAHSWVREKMQVRLQSHSYGQQALTAIINTEKNHQHIARQVFTTDGVLALLPLHDAQQCAMVWSVAHDKAQQLKQLTHLAFNKELQQLLGYELGQLSLGCERQLQALIMQHACQYTQAHVALVGDAAHTMHPLAGQGVNLGFADVSCLVKRLLQSGLVRGSCVNIVKQLRDYERQRKLHNARMISVVNGLNKLFGHQTPACSYLRGLGMEGINHLGWVKRLLMRVAVGDEGL